MTRLYLLKSKRPESDYFSFEVFFTLSALRKRKEYLESKNEYVSCASIVGELEVDKSCSFINSSLVEEFKKIC